jgi:RNA polymerase sigma-70 factor (ECF subfamily)
MPETFERTGPPPTPAPRPPLDPLAVFEGERGRLFGLAYRMLGSASEAEDVLQDAWLRWHAVNLASVERPAGFLVSLVTRLCLDNLKAARNRLTDYVGPWLPEPLVREVGDIGGIGGIGEPGPAALQEQADDLSFAFLLLLERLSPPERAVFLLRESFDFSYREIAGILGKTEAACRQIERRARQRLGADRASSVPAPPAEHERLLKGFMNAVRSGDVQSLVALLAEDAVFTSDGGGKANAARKPLEGADLIARFLSNLTRLAASGTWEIRLAEVNGRLGLLNFFNGKLLSVVSLHVENGRIQRLYFVLNPDKLRQTGLAV